MADNKMNTVLRLRHRPEGRVKETDLEVCKEPMPTIEDGQMLIQQIYISLDPTHRIWMSDRPQYMDPVAIDDIMRAGGVGVVRESKNPEYPVGTYVQVFGGVAEYLVGIPNVNVLNKIDLSLGLPLSAYCSIMTVIIGLTGWYGTRKVLNVTKDDIVVVSGASGAVGSLVGQLAKESGAKVIGIAGGETKCQNLIQNLGFDGAIDYKSEDIGAKLDEYAPEGITCYFDNVGGDITDQVLLKFQNKGRVAICGSISEYEDQWNGIKNFNMILMRRLSVKGYICIDHVEHIGEAFGEIGSLLSQGKLKYDEDIRKVGIDKYVETLNDLYTGKNTGKLMMQINEEK